MLVFNMNIKDKTAPASGNDTHQENEYYQNSMKKTNRKRNISIFCEGGGGNIYKKRKKKMQL